MMFQGILFLLIASVAIDRVTSRPQDPDQDHETSCSSFASFKYRFVVVLIEIGHVQVFFCWSETKPDTGAVAAVAAVVAVVAVAAAAVVVIVVVVGSLATSR